MFFGGVLYDAGSRIILDGDILDPSLEVKIDSNRMARVQFTPLSPWGESDFDWQVMEIVGPMDWDEMVHGNGDEDQRLDHFETPHTTMVGEANRYCKGMVGGQASLLESIWSMGASSSLIRSQVVPAIRLGC